MISISLDYKSREYQVGTRERSGFKKLLLGSITSSVVTYAHCPVMIVNTKIMLKMLPCFLISIMLTYNNNNITKNKKIL
jgi:hypothetical protein